MYTKRTENITPSIMDLQEILKTYGFQVENIGGICPKCGRYYKVHFHNEKTIEDVEKKRFRCRDCHQKEMEKSGIINHVIH
jgi:transposase-like protein